MLEYQATTTIAAPAAKVWAVLVDTAKWPQWDPSCERIEGEVALGNKIKAFTKLSPGRAFPVKVTEYRAGERMTWTGGMPRGLFKGVRTFTLTPAGTGPTRFHMREEYTGPLLPLIWRSMPDLQPSFDQFTQGLKQRVEHSPAR